MTAKSVVTQKSKAVRRIIGKRKKAIGKLGEELVVKHLKQRGLDLVEANYSKKFGEIDLVMNSGESLHFLEVKTVSREIDSQSRSEENKLHNAENNPNDVNHETAEVVIHETFSRDHENHEFKPEENVSPRKLKKIARMVTVYLSERKIGNRPWRFHVAVVYLDQKQKKALIKFIKDIPLSM